MSGHLGGAPLFGIKPGVEFHAASLDVSKRQGQQASKPSPFSIDLTMSDTERRARFIAWFEGPPMRGDRARLMERTGLTKGRVSQYFDEAQAFGERAAVNLAERLGLDGRAFLTDGQHGQIATDMPSAHLLSAEALLLAHSLDQIADHERRRVVYARCVAIVGRELPDSWEPGKPLQPPNEALGNGTTG